MNLSCRTNKFSSIDRVMIPLALLVDDELVDDELREQPTAQNDDNELFNLLNYLQEPLREGPYNEDEEDFGDEMHDNSEQR